MASDRPWRQLTPGHDLRWWMIGGLHSLCPGLSELHEGPGATHLLYMSMLQHIGAAPSRSTTLCGHEHQLLVPGHWLKLLAPCRRSGSGWRRSREWPTRMMLSEKSKWMTEEPQNPFNLFTLGDTGLRATA